VCCQAGGLASNQAWKQECVESAAAAAAAAVAATAVCGVTAEVPAASMAILLLLLLPSPVRLLPAPLPHEVLL